MHRKTNPPNQQHGSKHIFYSGVNIILHNITEYTLSNNPAPFASASFESSETR